MNDLTDQQLVERCLVAEQPAFEILVQRYQVLVCSIAYSVVGNVAASEDVGQEAFLSAWKKLSTLRDTKQFKSWLSTITRNEARAWLRRRSNSMQELREATLIPESVVKEEAVDREEADLVWQTLSQLPESYREPLVLYYRNERSVSEVAGALSLSQSATKQRLARGREMLRTEVLATIEQRLRKSVPTAAFAMGVMAVVSGSTKTAAAATGVTVAKVASTATKTAVGGAATGSLFGLLGAFAGTFASWYNAEYQSERTLIIRQSLIYLVGATIFTLPFLAIRMGWRPVETLGGRGYGIAYAIWMLFFLGLNFLWMFCIVRSHKKLKQKERLADTERLPRYAKALEEGRKVKGSRWKSSRSLLGLPLVDIAFPDSYVGSDRATIAQQGTARAWIAIGHFAHGRAIAVGTQRAIAPLAVGLQAIGVLSCGVFSLGLVSFGVVSIAALAAGVVCIGGISLGCSIAVGILAVAPMAFALKAAKGCMVFSLKFGEGPLVFAPHANDEAASQFMNSTRIPEMLDGLQSMVIAARSMGSVGYWVAGSVAVLAILLVLVQRVVFKRILQ